MEHSQQSIFCPECGSTALYAGQKGFDGNKGALGTALAGTAGLGLGMKGMGEVQITCLSCAFVFKPGEGAKSLEELQLKKKEIEENRKADEASELNKRYILAMVILLGGLLAWIFMFSGIH